MSLGLAATLGAGASVRPAELECRLDVRCYPVREDVTVLRDDEDAIAVGQHPLIHRTHSDARRRVRAGKWRYADWRSNGVGDRMCEHEPVVPDHEDPLPARAVLNQDPFILATGPDGLVDRSCGVNQVRADRMRKYHPGFGGNVGQRMDRKVRIAVVPFVFRYLLPVLAASTEHEHYVLAAQVYRQARS